MLKKTISISFIIPALACGPDTIVVYPRDQVDLPIDQLEYLDANTELEEEAFYAERHEFEPERAPEEEALEEEPIQEEQPVEEEFVEEEEEVLEEPIEEEAEEEEEIIEEEASFSGECDLGGEIYNFQSSCVHPLACLSRHVDNFDGAPETGFCGKVCYGDINCPGDTQCVLNGVTPGVGYCER
jgi:hypothetical protein